MNLPKIKPTRHTVLIASIVALAAIMLTVVSWLFWVNSKEGAVGPVTTPQSVDSVLAKSMDYENTDDADEGIAFYDEQIEQREDKGEKQQLLIYKSNFALKAKKGSVALESAEQANEIESNPASLMALAYAHEGLGDKQKAIFYYKELIERAPDEGMGSRYKTEWKRKIEELES